MTEILTTIGCEPNSEECDKFCRFYADSHTGDWCILGVENVRLERTEDYGFKRTPDCLAREREAQELREGR